MKASITHRTTCRLCDSSDVELVVKLEPIPLSENYCKDPDTGKQAERYPVDLYMCRSCGLVQQLDVVDSKSLWEAYTYYSGDAKGMPEHFNEVAKKLIQIKAYRGIRRLRGLPIRGQRTHTNAKTASKFR